MRRSEANGIPLLRFGGLEDAGGLVHAVTTKAGGVSAGPFAGLNLGGSQDDPAAVAANREALRRALGLESLVWARQVHGDRVVAVAGGETPPVAEADGLATDRPGVGLMILTADCQSVVLYAPERGVVANLHAGWRGQVAGIVGAGVAFLGRRYGVRPEELMAAVGPSLGPCCAEFVNWAEELPPSWAAYQVRPHHFDLWQATWDQLAAAGVPRERIETAGVCTKCSPKFFSYRREGATGRFAAVAALEPRP